MTRGDLVEDLGNRVGPGVDLDGTALARWINDAYMYICDEISKVEPEFFSKSSRTSSVDGQQEYTLPSDFEKILMVNIQLDGAWKRARPIQRINNISVHEDPATSGFTSADPRYYVIADEIGFLPIPAETTSNNIKIWYTYTPPELDTDTKVPAIPTKYHHLISFGALANYLDRDGDHAQAEGIRRRFESRVAQLCETMETTQFDEPKSIEIVSGYDLYMDDENYS